MMCWTDSEKRMLAREAGYIENLKQVEGVSPEVLAAMVSLYRAGWRDCWEAEIVAEWEAEAMAAWAASAT